MVPVPHEGLLPRNCGIVARGLARARLEHSKPSQRSWVCRPTLSPPPTTLRFRPPLPVASAVIPAGCASSTAVLRAAGDVIFRAAVLATVGHPLDPLSAAEPVKGATAVRRGPGAAAACGDEGGRGAVVANFHRPGWRSGAGGFPSETCALGLFSDG